MRSTLILGIAAAVLVAGCADVAPYGSDRQVKATRGTLEAPMVAKGPPLDGTLNSPIWQKCPPLVLGNVSSEEVGELKTLGRVLFTPTHLYVAWECTEPDTSVLKADAAGRDEDVWQDDCVELFISPDLDEGVYHFAINAKAVLQDWKAQANDPGDLAWNGSAEVKATIEKNKRWIVTMRVPLKELGAWVGENQTWRMNLNRSRPAGSNQWIESSWSSQGRSRYHDTDGWGKVTGLTVIGRADGVTRTRAGGQAAPAGG